MPSCKGCTQLPAVPHHLVTGLLVLLLLVHPALSSNTDEIFKYGDDPEKEQQNGTHWTYDLAGGDWVGTDAEGKPWMCLTGKQQSPVNLPLSSPAVSAIDATHRSTFQLGSVVSNGSSVAVANTGHSVQVFWTDPAFAPKVSIMVQDGQPLLSNLDLHWGNKATAVTALPRQFHFHTHSEHLVSGHMYPLEVHLVSVVQQSELPACPPGGCLVVTAVLFELADDLTSNNTWLGPLFDHMPYKEGDVNYLPAGATLDLQQLLPSNTSYLAYSGSLTTPPCTEGVLWMVMVNTQKVSLQQWRSLMTAVGDYNCTLAPAGLGEQLPPGNTSGSSSSSDSSTGSSGDTNGSSSSSSTLPSHSTADPIEPQSSTAPAAADTQALLLGGLNSTQQPTADLADSSNSSSSSPELNATAPALQGTPNRLLQQQSVWVSSGGLHRQLAEAAAEQQHYVCNKLGAGSNRLPQELNGRVLRIWRDVTSKKSLLPEDAASAASAGAIAGIVLGVTLGAGLTAGFGYLAYKLYNKRRLKRFYNMGVSDNDMMMVQQEVESQWLSASNTNNAPIARISRTGASHPL